MGPRPAQIKVDHQERRIPNTIRAVANGKLPPRGGPPISNPKRANHPDRKSDDYERESDDEQRNNQARDRFAPILLRPSHSSFGCGIGCPFLVHFASPAFVS
jgi:hypothetical protein